MWARDAAQPEYSISAVVGNPLVIDFEFDGLDLGEATSLAIDVRHRDGTTLPAVLVFTSEGPPAVGYITIDTTSAYVPDSYRYQVTMLDAQSQPFTVAYGPLRILGGSIA